MNFSVVYDFDVKAYRDAMRMSHYTSLDTRDLERSSRYWFKKFQSACMYLEALRAEANLLKRIKDA